MGAMEHLTEQTGQITGSLGGNMVEVDAVSDSMHDGEEQSGECYDLVEGYGGIEGNVLVKGGLPEEGDEVPGHGQQQNGISPHHARGSTSSNCDTISSNTTQPSIFSLHRVIYSAIKINIVQLYK